jgi:hypothetical protein
LKRPPPAHSYDGPDSVEALAEILGDAKSAGYAAQSIMTSP